MWAALVVICSWTADGSYCVSTVPTERFRNIGDCYLWLDRKRDQFNSDMQHQTLGGCTEAAAK